jgi:hypothetical protein
VSLIPRAVQISLHTHLVDCAGAIAVRPGAIRRKIIVAYELHFKMTENTYRAIGKFIFDISQFEYAHPTLRS